MEEKNNMDKMFKDRLGKDNPAFKDEYWQGFEKMLEAAAPVSTAGSSSGFGKALHLMTTTKGIISIVTFVTLSTATYFYSKSLKDNQITQKVESIQAPLSFSTHPDDTIVVFSTPTGVSNPFSLSSSTTAVNVASQPGSIQTANQALSEKQTVTPSKQISNSIVSSVATPQNKKEIRSRSSNEKALIPGRNGVAIVAEGSPDEVIALKEKFSGTRTDTKQPVEKGMVNDLTGSIPGRTLPQDSSLFQYTDNQKPDAQKEEFPTGNQPIVRKDDSPPLIPAAIPADLPTAQSGAIPGLTSGIFAENKLFKLFLAAGATSYTPFGNTSGFSGTGRVGFQFGAGTWYEITKEISVLAETDYLRTSGHQLSASSESTDYLFTKWVGRVTVENREINLLHVPVLLRYRYKFHMFSAGLSLQYILSCTGEKTTVDSVRYQYKYNHEKADNYIGGFNRLTAGLTAEYSCFVFRQNAILLRYTYYLNDMLKKQYYEGIKSPKPGYLFIGLRCRIF
ncbi:MAG: hypothetical protein NTU44_01895 [Bacteroidetes bacterium]|nr:hypothetical protein [Bacteroidota bacterium]